MPPLAASLTRGACAPAFAAKRCSSSSSVAARAAPRPSAASAPQANDAVVGDIVRAARSKIQSEGYDFDAAPVVPIKPASASAKANDTSTLAGKFKAAWNIFFPPTERTRKPRSAREEGKNRLRMILVADRCGMTQSSLYEMKHSIVQVLSDFVEVEGGEDLVDVSVTADGEAGTIYSVSVPVRRIKPSVRVAGAVAAATSPSSTVATSRTTAAAAASIRAGSAAAVSDSSEENGEENEEETADGVSLEWETDPEADASARFPYGV